MPGSMSVQSGSVQNVAHMERSGMRSSVLRSPRITLCSIRATVLPFVEVVDKQKTMR